MGQVLCSAVVRLTLEIVPPSGGVTHTWSCALWSLGEIIHSSGNRKHFLKDAFLYNI